MKSRIYTGKPLSMLVAASMLITTVSCGTLMHPERKGQTGGRIDAGIAILDGIGLLFFLIPGIIAYAVDFSNGTIYLPPGEASRTMPTNDLDHMLAIHVDPQTLTSERIEQIIAEHTGQRVDLHGGDVVLVQAAELEPAG